MAVVGSAEILVRAITSQVKNDIQKGLRDAMPAIASEGEKAGKTYSDGFGRGSQGNLGRSFQDALRAAGLAEAAGHEGENAGQALVDDAGNAIEAGASDVGSKAERALGGAGRRGGDGFLKGFLSSGFANAAKAASSEFTVMEGVFNTVGPAVAGLINALGSGAAGLFSMAAAASQASGALAVLPGAISVAAQAFGVFKIATIGVSRAITDGFKAATATSTSTAQTAISNARSIADAQTALGRAQAAAAQAVAGANQRVADAGTALARARQSAAQSLADATRQVAQAEISVASAQRNTLAAQQALNVARAEGVKQLRDLAFQAEDAGLAEQQAGLDLVAARKRLQEAQALPTDDPARQQAELAFKQADLNLREAKARNSDLAGEEKKAAKAGVDGTDAVVTAKQKINAAVKSQQSAEQQLADARRARQKTEIQNAQSISDAEKALGRARQARAQVEIQNAQSISDAQLRLNRALQDQKNATNQATSATNTYQQALARLSPPAREFVKHLVAMKPEFDKLRAAAGDQLFPHLTAGLDEIGKNLLPVLIPLFRETGLQIGEIAKSFATTISTGKGLTLIGNILRGNNGILDVFTDKTRTGRNAIGNLVIVAERLLLVIQPLTKRFFEWIRGLTVTAARATDTQKKMGKFADFLKHAGDVAAQLGRIFGNLFKAILILGGGATKSGQGLLDSFEGATKHLDKFLQKLRDNGSMQKFFGTAAKNLKAIGRFLVEVFKQLVRISNSDAAAKFFNNLGPAVKGAGDIAVKLRDASVKMAPFINAVVKFFDSFITTQHTAAFIATLGVITSIINGITGAFAKLGNLPIIGGSLGKLFLVGAAFFGITRAISFALVPLKFFFEAFTGGSIKGVTAFLKIRDKLATSFKTFKSDGFIAGLKSLGQKSDESKLKLEKQMKVDELKKKSLQELGDAAEVAAGQLKTFKDAAAPLPGEMRALGAETAKGLKLGFEENSQGFVDALVRVAKEAVRAVRVELGIASPSKVMFTIGEEAGKGFALGMDAETAQAREAGARLGAAGAEGAKAASGGAAGAADLSAISGAGKGAKIGETVASDAAKVEKEGGRFSKAFGGIGKALAGAVGLFLPFSIGLEGAGAAIAAAIGPILLIVGAIAAFIGIFILLYKQSPQFKIFIDNIVGKIKELVHWFMNVALPAIEAFGRWIGDNFVKLVVPPLNAFFGFVNDALPKIGAAFGVTFHAIADVWHTVLEPVFKVIGKVIEFLWKFVVKPYLKAIQLEFKVVFAAIKLLWEKVLKPIFEAIITIIEFLWKNVVRPIFSLIVAFIRLEFRGIQAIWENILKPVIDEIVTAFNGIKSVVQTVFGAVTTVWDRFVSAFKVVRTDIGNIIGDITGAFGDVGSAVGNAFKGLGKEAASGLNSFIGFLNRDLIGKINSVTSHFGFKIDSIPTIALAEGGRVRGPGGEKDDRVPAMLSNNEFVMSAKAARQIGYDVLEAANRGGGLSWPHPHIPSVSDIKHLAGNTVNGVKNIGETIAKEGLGKALSAVVKGAEKLMSRPFPRGKGIDDLFYGILDKLANAVETWGGSSGKGLSDAPSALKNLSNLKHSGKWLFPVAGPWTYNGGYPYGAHPSPNYWHTGSDFDAKLGTPLVAMNTGIVQQVTNLGDRSYGRFVVIDYGTYQTLYAHMSAFATALRAGERVTAGSRIGNVGYYGNVIPHSPAGSHLHLEVSKSGQFGSMGNTIDPIEWLKKLGFKFASGGVVSPVDGGVLGVIAEAGKSERIEPLDTEGFSKRDRAILDMIQQLLERDGKGDTIVVNPSRGMNELELANAVAGRLQFRRRTGS